MLRFLQSEAELACILAYEMASLQYPYPQLSRVKKILEHLTQAGMMVGSAFGEIGALTAIGLLTLQVALKAQELTPQKKTQLVDQDALAMVANAGYNPQSYLHLLYTMQQISPPLKPYLYDYSQSHPLTDARIRLVAEKVQQFPKEIFFASAHEELYQKMTRSLGSAYSR
ncbi:hypothetical protein D6817_00810 [Candidatus Pacearchaeota archaeon]|nr:MAG: hypothetical protein D6817_00810 [Candidatus Pacearchaeota archaeon]